MKKKIIGSCILIVGILLSGSVVYNETTENLKNVTRKEQLEVFEEAKKQVDIGDSYIEHITEIQSDGYTVDTYVDRENGLEQMDTYENNELVNRVIFYDKGSKYLSIGKDDQEFEGVMTKLDESIAKENKNNFENYCKFEDYTLNTLEQGKSTFFREEKTSDTSVIKYISRNLNLYFDKESNFLVKKEEIVGDEISKTIKFEKIERTSKLGKSLFKQESPLILGEKIDLSNIKIKNVKYELEAPLKDARG